MRVPVVASLFVLLPSVAGAAVPSPLLLPEGVAPLAGRLDPTVAERQLAEVRAATQADEGPRVLAQQSFDGVQIIDDVVLLDLEACDSEPRSGEPTCSAYYMGTGFGGRHFYGYTWSHAILVNQLFNSIGNHFEIPIFFSDFYTSDYGGGYYQPIFNDTEGLGSRVFDLRWQYGVPDSLLRGVISMNLWWDCERGQTFQDGCADEAPWTTSFRSLHGVLGQEVGHQWGAFFGYADRPGAESYEWLGRDESHWSYWFNSGGSPLEGNHWIDDGDGSFHLSRVDYTKYNDFDLYAMGVLPPEEVKDSFFIRVEDCAGAWCDPATPPESGARRVRGERVDVGIKNVIGLHGPRSPAFGESPRVSRQVFVLNRIAGSDKDLTAGLEKLGRARRFWNEYFYEATRYRMRAITTVSGLDDYPRWEFLIDGEGWQNGAGTQAHDGSHVILRADADGLDFLNDQIELEPSRLRSARLRLGLSPSAKGKRVRIEFGSGAGEWDSSSVVEITPTADGKLRPFALDLSELESWRNTVEAFALRISLVDASEGDELYLDRLFFSEAALADEDGDGVVDEEDNCVSVANASQADEDGDGIGDECASDRVSIGGREGGDENDGGGSCAAGGGGFTLLGFAAALLLRRRRP